MFNVGAAEELRLNGLRSCLSIRLRETRAYHESIVPSQASKASNVAIKATRKALKITLLFLLPTAGMLHLFSMVAATC